MCMKIFTPTNCLFHNPFVSVQKISLVCWTKNFYLALTVPRLVRITYLAEYNNIGCEYHACNECIYFTHRNNSINQYKVQYPVNSFPLIY